MNIITVIDDRGGLMFNRRRLSQDRVLREMIVEISCGRHPVEYGNTYTSKSDNPTNETSLWMNAYTAKQFDPLPANAVIDENFLENAGDKDYCFAEDKHLLPYKDKISTFYLFHWNRKYPSDLKLDLIPEQEGLKLMHTEDFAGYSHEKITLEVWER